MLLNCQLYNLFVQTSFHNMNFVNISLLLFQVLVTDYQVHLSNQEAAYKSSKKDKNRTATNDVTKDLKNLTINNSPKPATKSEDLNQAKPPVDDLKQELRQTHEKELQDMEKVVKKLFADDILEDVPGAEGGATNDAKDDDAKRQDARRVAKKREEVIPDQFYQRTAKVVYIIEKKHSRACTGHLKKQSSQVSLLGIESYHDSPLE